MNILLRIYYSICSIDSMSRGGHKMCLKNKNKNENYDEKKDIKIKLKTKIINEWLSQINNVLKMKIKI